MTETEQTYCGFITIMGRPNVGKSTLMNRMLGEKISITSRKPQTTRHRISGIHTVENKQIIYLDTPGVHSHQKKALNRYMNRAALDTLTDVDLVLFMIDASGWTEDDAVVLKYIAQKKRPCFLIINKIDQQKDKQKLHQLISSCSELYKFDDIVLISAKQGTQVQSLEDAIFDRLPESPFFYLPEQICDRSDRFRIAEIIREKMFRHTGEELPYGMTVEIEQFKLDGQLYRIAAILYVERDSHKRMIIGKGGEKLKIIGTEARIDIERILGKKVFLQLWVKIKSNWADDVKALNSLGYD